ncbi:methyltransferase domain-containing protein [Candidatus Woesearchaeota archaeon]|nr:methyltransferase domain-containing protein [Candidatus Woesearchaeota archaeon]
MTKVTKRDSCRLCSSNKLELVVKMAATPIGDAYMPKEEAAEKFPLDMYLCMDCGLLQLTEAIDPAEVYGPYIYRTSDSLGLVEHFGKYADAALAIAQPAEGTLAVDIGSNDGSFLRFFKNRGMRVLGIDPAEKIAKEATESGIETVPSLFTAELAAEIRRKYGPAKIVTANNTFANIDDLQSMLKGIKKLLDKDGIFVIETGYVLDLLKKNIIDNIYHEHLSYFAIKPLDTFFANNGMELINAERVPTKGGSIRCTIQLNRGKHQRSEAAEGMIKAEGQEKLHEPQTYRAFAQRMEMLKENLNKMLAQLQSEGRKIAAYGASVGVTTMLHQFGLDKSKIMFLVDDNKARQKLYSPGLNIPVKGREALIDEQIDYAVILAWQYEKPIMEKNKKFLEGGGRFITILPEVKTI